MNNIYIYDIETYPNYFVVGIVEPDGTILKLKDISEIITYFGDKSKTFVGFNNHKFDDVIIANLHQIDTPKLINDLTDVMINDAVNYSLPSLDKSDLNTIDLFKLGNGGSLKKYEIELRLPKVEELPFKPGTILSDEQKEIVDIYLDNDLLATKTLYNKLLPIIDSRKSLGELYPAVKNIIFKSSAPKLAEQVCLTEYSSKVNKPLYEISVLKDHIIDFNTIIFPFIKFNNPKNQETLQRIKNLPVQEIKVSNYESVKIERGKLTALIKKEKLVFYTKSQEHTFGLGGLHSINHQKYIGTLFDIDVASYYPSLMYQHNIKPRHISYEFLEVLHELKLKRLEVKKLVAEGQVDLKTTDLALKLVINSIFGQLGQFGKLLDLEAMYSVTINGQLLLMMLAEKLEAAGLEVIMSNTDGLFIKGDVAENIIKEIYSDWETLSKCDLDIEKYDAYLPMHVNDYGLIKDNVFVKNKGSIFGTGTKIPKILTKMVSAYYLYGTSLEETVKTGDDFDYMSSSTTKRNKGVIGTECNGKNYGFINRFYRSTSGAPLYRCVIKDNEEKKLAITTDKVIIANDYNGNLENLDHQYYIAAAQKLIDSLDKGEYTKGSTEDLLLRKYLVCNKIGFNTIYNNQNSYIHDFKSNRFNPNNQNLEISISNDFMLYTGPLNLTKSILNEKYQVIPFNPALVDNSNIETNKTVKFEKFVGGTVKNLTKKNLNLLFNEDLLSCKVEPSYKYHICEGAFSPASTDGDLLSYKNTTWPKFIEDYGFHKEVNTKVEADLILGCEFKLPTDKNIKLANKNNIPVPNTVGRCHENVKGFHILPIDFDANVSIDEAIEKYKDFEFLLYTTYSHSLEKDKFRLIFPLSKPISNTDFSLRKTSIESFFEGADNVISKRLQGFFAPSYNKSSDKSLHKIVKNKGKLFDLYDLEEDIPFEQLDDSPKIKTSDKNIELLIDGMCDLNQVWHTQDDYNADSNPEYLAYNTFLPMFTAFKNIGANVEDVITVFQNLRPDQANLSKWYNCESPNIDVKVILKVLNTYGIHINLDVYEEIKIENEDFEINLDSQSTDILKMMQSGENLIIKAPTGAGKSYSTIEFIKECLKTEQKVMCVCGSANARIEPIAEALSFEEKVDLIDVITASEFNTLNGKISGSQKVKDESQIVLTNFAQTSRMGDSLKFKNILNFVDSETIVIVDEFDSFMSNKIKNVILNSIGIPVKGQKNTYKVVGERLEDVDLESLENAIPLVDDAGYDHGMCIKRDIFNRYSIQTKRDDSLIFEKSFVAPTGFKSFDIDKYRTDEVYEPFESGTTKITKLKQSGLSRSSTDDVEVDSSKIIEEYINTGWYACLIEQTKNEASTSTNWYDGVKVLSFFDPIVLKNIKRCKQFIGLTATLPNWQSDCLSSVIRHKIKEIWPKEERKMNKIKLITYKKDINLVGQLLKDNYSFPQSVLFFDKNQITGDINFDKLNKTNNYDVRYITNKNKVNSNPHYKVKGTDQPIYITTPHGAAGRGENLGHIKSTWLNVKSFKPFFVMNLNSDDYLKNIAEDAMITNVQCGGRIIRFDENDETDTGERTIYCIDKDLIPEEINTLKTDLQKMCKDGGFSHIEIDSSFPKDWAMKIIDKVEEKDTFDDQVLKLSKETKHSVSQIKGKIGNNNKNIQKKVKVDKTKNKELSIKEKREAIKTKRKNKLEEIQSILNKVDLTKPKELGSYFLRKAGLKLQKTTKNYKLMSVASEIYMGYRYYKPYNDEHELDNTKDLKEEVAIEEVLDETSNKAIEYDKQIDAFFLSLNINHLGLNKYILLKCYALSFNRYCKKYNIKNRDI